MKSHELADIFPMMTPKEYKELKEDIKTNGLMQPVVIYEGKILDGRNRYNACNELGITPTTETYTGTDALQYVMSTNLKRRNLTDSQKAVVGIKYKKYYSIYAKQRQGTRGDIVEPVPQSEVARARDQAGEQAGVSGRMIDMTEELIRKNPEAERLIMEEGAKVKTLLKEVKKEEQKKAIEKLKAVTGEYDIIVIDPPWGTVIGEYDDDGARGVADYPTMDVAQVKKIKLPLKKDAVVWLWFPNYMIEHIMEIVKAWELEPKTVLTWDKVNMGVGHFLRNVTEHCLLCFKGKPYFNNTKWTTLIREKRTTHSTKPEIFYKMVEEICAGRKLDYFARKKRKGWDVYGDEIEMIQEEE